MTYQVLARKWRPKDFASLVGQEHVVRALRHALETKRLHHAYLFTGTRGVGKTTLARILAKSINCEKGITSKPCGKCGPCRHVQQHLAAAVDRRFMMVQQNFTQPLAQGRAARIAASHDLAAALAERSGQHLNLRRFAGPIDAIEAEEHRKGCP